MKKILPYCLVFLFLSNPGFSQTAWVIGGAAAEEGQFPWLGDLRVYNAHFCGSSLIHPKWVLTAAHCVEEIAQNTNIARVRFNTVNTNGPINPEEGIQTKITKVYIHPDFDISDIGNGNDIALLYLTDSITGIDHATLPYITDTADKYEGGSSIFIAGWGINDTVTLDSPDTLQWAIAKVYNTQACNDLLGSASDRIFCIGYTAGEEAKGSAAGDSGGPAWKNENDKPVIYGIVSGGAGPTTLTDFPGIFTKVAYYRPWIDSVMMSAGSTPVGIDKISEQDLFASKIRIVMDGYQLQIQLNTVDNVACNIWDMQGRLVFSRQLQSSRPVQYNIPLDRLASGAYVLRINNQKGQQVIRKIAKH